MVPHRKCKPCTVSGLHSFLVAKALESTRDYQVNTEDPLFLRSTSLTLDSIIFVHGLRGHPVKTWESRSSVDSESAAASSGFRHNVRSLFKSKAPVSESDNETRNDAGLARNNFWPKDYLAEDIPGARVWTYGYNAEVVGGSFQANNKNSVSQHGRDLRVKLERDLENEVAKYCVIFW